MTDRVWLAHVVWPNAGRGDPAGRGAGGGGALPVVQHDPGQRAVAGRGAAGRRRAGRARRGRVGVGGLRVAVAGGPDGDAAGQAAPRRRRRCRPGTPWRWPPAAARPASGATGEIGELSVGCLRRPGRLAAGRRPRSPGALSDPVEAWLRCGPVVRAAHGRRRAARRRGRRPGARRPRRAARRPPPGVRSACRPVPLTGELSARTGRAARGRRRGPRGRRSSRPGAGRPAAPGRSSRRAPARGRSRWPRCRAR